MSDEIHEQVRRVSKSTYISPRLPAQIRGLYRADLREKSIQTMLDLAGDLIQELIDLKASPVLPSSGVDEDALAEVIGSHRISHLGQCECGHVLETYGHHNHEPEEIMEHLARAVAAWLKDGAR